MGSGARWRARHAKAEGRACRRCRQTQPPSMCYVAGAAVVWTFTPVVVAPSGEGFRGTIQNRNGGADCLSEAEGAASFSAAREKPRSEGKPGPHSGPGSRQSGVFLGYFFARAKKPVVDLKRARRAGETALGRRPDQATVNTEGELGPASEIRVQPARALRRAARNASFSSERPTVTRRQSASSGCARPTSLIRMPASRRAAKLACPCPSRTRKRMKFA